jgi:hypothetical protein
MTPFVKSTDRPTPETATHAHLLVAETGGLIIAESPEAVMAEVEFRATHLSSLMKEMLEEAAKHELWEEDES